MDITLIKTMAGLMPADTSTQDWYNKIKTGSAISVKAKTIRNYKFLKKYFALLNIGFDHWTPGEINSKYGTPEKNFDRFRKDVAILCGFYDIVVRLDNSTRPEARSISFAAMEEEEFEDLYSKTIDVFLKHLYGAGMDAKEIDRIVNEYLQFAS